MFVCKTCGKSFDFDYRKSRPKSERKTPLYCSRSCANSRGKRSLETKSKIRNKLKGSLGSGYIDGRMCNSNKRCKICNKKLNYNNKSGFCKEHLTQSEDYRQKISESNKGKTGGYNAGSVKNHIHGWYGNYYFDSSWELIWIRWALKNNIVFERNTHGFPYMFNNEVHLYYPDFYLCAENKYVEVKGYMDDRWVCKLKFFPFSLDVVGKKEIEKLKKELD